MRWDVGIDLGTDGVRLAEIKAGPTLGEASAVAFREGQRQPFAAGDAARALEGRACAGVEVARPLLDGTLRNPYHAQCLLNWAFASSGEISGKRRFSALVTCSPTSRPVQSEALMNAATEAGATDAALVRTDAATAVGAGLNVLAPQASLLLDLGAGKITATLFTMGRVAECDALPYGMDRIDERIQRGVRTQLGFAISRAAAQELKHAMGAASAQSSPMTASMNTAGLDMAQRLPRVFTVTPEPVVTACVDVVREIVGMAAGVVDRAPAELAADLNDAGVVLAGGGALLSGLDKVIGDALGIPCRVAEAPQSCGVRGLCRMMEDPKAYRAFFRDSATAGNTWR